MVNKEPLLNLLRTNSTSKYLVRRSQNQFVGYLRELLNDLGYGTELNWSKLGNSASFGTETSTAVSAFAKNNQQAFDNITVSPLLLTKMIQCYDALDGVRLLQRSYNQKQLPQAFNLYDPNNYGSLQLLLLLEVLGIYEPYIGVGLRTYLQRKGLPVSYSNQLNDSVASALLSDLLPRYGKDIDLHERPIANTTPLPTRELSTVEFGQVIRVTDGIKEVAFSRKNEGLYTNGSLSVEKFIENNSATITQQYDLTPSALSIIKAISANEGHFDAINTYDSAFLSFGIFQWTLGKLNIKGELPALLKKIKTSFPAVFNNYFSTYGIDVSAQTNETIGTLLYNGSEVLDAPEKTVFRSPNLAYRFWRAGQDANVQAAQVEHAISRLKNFYWKESAQSYPINHLITSAYGVALLLDHHVNRPAWVKPCLELGIRNSGVSLPPYAWTDADEQRVLAAYIDVRETYQEPGHAPMTASRLRAQKIYKKVLESSLSDRRGSFQYSELAMRSATPTAYDSFSALSSVNAHIVPPPPYYSPDDYPLIEMDGYDR